MKQKLGVPVIVLRDNKVLLAKRIKKYGAGQYGLPGGHLDARETIEACAIRELSEEVGIVATAINTIGVVKEWQATQFFIHFIVVCTKWEGEIVNLEPEKSENWQWYSLDNLPENILPGHLAGLNILLSELKQFQVVEI